MLLLHEKIEHSNLAMGPGRFLNPGHEKVDALSTGLSQQLLDKADDSHIHSISSIQVSLSRFLDVDVAVFESKLVFIIALCLLFRVLFFVIRHIFHIWEFGGVLVFSYY